MIRAIVISALMYGLFAPPAVAQIPGTTPGRPEFEVASVKPNNSGSQSSNFRPLPGGQLAGVNVALSNLIRTAYNVRSFEISAAPAWTDTARYDISAKAETSATLDEMRPMLQSLLADRFKLKVHHETKELPVYELVAAKSGFKFAPPKEGTCIPPDPNRSFRSGEPLPPICGGAIMDRGRIDAYAITMSALADDLSNVLRRTIVDKTGFAGILDVHLEYRPEDDTAAESAVSSIFTALREQLGLRLEPAKAPVEILVIDHVERASEN